MAAYRRSDESPGHDVFGMAYDAPTTYGQFAANGFGNPIDLFGDGELQGRFEPSLKTPRYVTII